MKRVSSFAAIPSVIQRGGIGVLPTDTLYGIVASALNKKAVERVYAVRRRNPKKPCIILISSLADLRLFNIIIDEQTSRLLADVWPNKISVVLPCANEQFQYLHRGTKSLAFRMPRSKRLLAVLKKTGPLIAPSANHEGGEPAYTLKEARAYFNDEIDFYVGNRRKLLSKPSTLVALTKKGLIVLRQGAVVLP